MNKTFVTFLKGGGKEEDLLENRVKAYAWEYDETAEKFLSPRTIELAMETRIPTWQSKEHNINLLRKSVENFKRQIRLEFGSRLNDLRNELRTTRPGTKKHMALQHRQEYIQDFLGHIDERMRLEGPFGKYAHKVYHFITPFFSKGTQHFSLEREFMTGSKYNSALRQRYLSFRFPFALIEQRDGKYVFLDRRLETSALLKAPGLAVDFETANWERIRMFTELSELPETELKRKFFGLVELNGIKFDSSLLNWMDRKDYIRGIEGILNETKDERLTLGILSNLDADYNHLVTTLDCGQKEIIIDVPGRPEKKRFTVTHVRDQHELIQAFNELFHKFNPLWVYGHYHMKFDYGKAEELTQNLALGVEGAHPLHISQAAQNFIVQKILPGRLDIDASGYSRNYMKNYNNKLDTVLRAVCGISSKKTMTYAELAEQTIRAENGSKEDALEMLYYGGQDGMKSYMICEALKLEHILLGEMTASLPARIDSVSRRTISEDYWVRWAWRFKYTYPWRSLSSVKARIKRMSLKTSAEQNNKPAESGQMPFDDFSSIDYMYCELLARSQANHQALLNITKGINQGILVGLFPFQKAFKSMLIRDSAVEEVYKQISMIPEAKKKFGLLTSLESLSEYPLFKAIDMDMEENWFAMEFNLGFSKKELETHRGNVTEVLDQAYALMKESPPVNMNHELFVFPCDAAKADEFITKVNSSGLGVVLGKGTFLSGARGRFAGEINNELIMQGIADPESKKGERCIFEKQFYENFLRYVIMNKDVRVGLEYLLEKAVLLRQGKISREELVFEREARKDHTDYSTRAHRIGYVKRILDQKVAKEDLLKYEYYPEKLLEKFFGIDSLGEPVERKGTISELVEWVFNFERKSPEAHILRRVYMGRADQVDINSLLFAHQLRFNK